MEILANFLSPAGPCGYLPHEVWQLEYEIVRSMSAEEFSDRLIQGWRRFGHALFRPRCPQCSSCLSLRVNVAAFQPSRSQRRNARMNAGVVSLRIGAPAVTRAKLALYDRFHAFQTERKGWPLHEPKDSDSYFESFVFNPFTTEEWTYWLGSRLVGVGYVDAVSAGLSAIYFFYDPRERHRGLGTWNVLCCIDQARQRGLPHVYLGYYVAGCPSLEYKATFRPNETVDAQGVWQTFRQAGAKD
jgi:arginyl-tRNA--protein-N-Asp/Glu arginylyltransferase